MIFLRSKMLFLNLSWSVLNNAKKVLEMNVSVIRNGFENTDQYCPLLQNWIKQSETIVLWCPKEALYTLPYFRARVLLAVWRLKLFPSHFRTIKKKNVKKKVSFVTFKNRLNNAGHNSYFIVSIIMWFIIRKDWFNRCEKTRRRQYNILVSYYFQRRNDRWNSICCVIWIYFGWLFRCILSKGFYSKIYAINFVYQITELRFWVHNARFYLILFYFDIIYL